MFDTNLVLLRYFLLICSIAPLVTESDAFNLDATKRAQPAPASPSNEIAAESHDSLVRKLVSNSIWLYFCYKIAFKCRLIFRFSNWLNL